MSHTRSSGYKALFIVIAATVLLIFFNILVDDYFTKIIIGFIERPLGYIENNSTSFKFWFESIKSAHKLTKENRGLTEENLKLKSQLGETESIQSENYALRKALGLPGRLTYNLIDGAIFSRTFLPASTMVLLNKGENNGVAIGDAVVAADGILIGQIGQTYPSYARVILTTDPMFKTTARILNSGIGGIAKGIMNGELSLDLVAQNEIVMKGDIVVTSGNDSFPTGLIIGDVSGVISKEGDVFHKINISASIRNLNSNTVLILSR